MSVVIPTPGGVLGRCAAIHQRRHPRWLCHSCLGVLSGCRVRHIQFFLLVKRMLSACNFLLSQRPKQLSWDSLWTVGKYSLTLSHCARHTARWPGARTVLRSCRIRQSLCPTVAISPFLNSPGHAGRETMQSSATGSLTSTPRISRRRLNTRLRELGGEPPQFDYTARVWFGRPAAAWKEPGAHV